MAMMTATTIGGFDRQAGTLDGVPLCTFQSFRDPEIVSAHADAGNREVVVTRPFEWRGRTIRMVIDGHHRLTAAAQTGVAPEFTIAGPGRHPKTRMIERGEIDAFMRNQRVPGNDLRNAVTGVLI